MIRILFFADTHLGFDYPIRPRLDIRRRGPDFFANYHRVLDHAREGRFDLVVHGGDLFFRARVPARVVDLVYEPLLEFAARGIPIVVVPGNHERSRLPTSLCLSHPNVHVFHEPATFVFDVRGVRLAVAGFPFERTDIRRRFPDLLAATGYSRVEADIRLLCCHQTIEGARVGPAGYTFRRGRDVIRREDLPDDVTGVLCGHIHRRQVLTRARADGSALRVVYPGSTERTSFAEKDEPKGYFEITLAREPGRGWDVTGLRFRELPTRPMADVELDGSVTASSLVPFLRDRVSELDPDSVVRLRGPDDFPEAVRHQLTNRLLRSIFPATMTVQLGRRLRRDDGPHPTR